MLNSNKKQSKTIYYLMLFAVIILWGIDPIVNTMQYKNYSPLALAIINTFFSATLFFILSIKKLKQIDKKFLKIAIPIGTINSLACILQRIGLIMTTPVNYAFLEHLSCAFVPIALFLITKKRPSAIQLFVTIMCLVGCMLISGILGGNVSFGIGDLLCATAGVMFGFSITLMSIHLKNVDMSLFTFFQFITYFILSLILALALNFIKVGSAPIETFRFSFNLTHILFAVFFGLVSVGFGWLMRNLANSRLNPVFISVTSPFSAIISAIVSIICKTDELSIHLIIGGALIISSAIISGVIDSKHSKL